jgi:hypothetical protein
MLPLTQKSALSPNQAEPVVDLDEAHAFPAPRDVHGCLEISLCRYGIAFADTGSTDGMLGVLPSPLDAFRFVRLACNESLRRQASFVSRSCMFRGLYWRTLRAPSYQPSIAPLLSPSLPHFSCLAPSPLLSPIRERRGSRPKTVDVGPTTRQSGNPTGRMAWGVENPPGVVGRHPPDTATAAPKTPLRPKDRLRGPRGTLSPFDAIPGSGPAQTCLRRKSPPPLPAALPRALAADTPLRSQPPLPSPGVWKCRRDGHGGALENNTITGPLYDLRSIKSIA